MKNSFPFIKAGLAMVAIVGVGACQNIPNVSPNTGTLIGAGTGAVAGAVIGDGGIILPAIGAIGGAVIGEEVAERDPLFD